MSAELGWIEKAMMLVPGYRGYKKRELLREDDRLLRGHVANVLREASGVLQQAVAELVQALGFQAQAVIQQPGNPVSILNMVQQRLYNVAARVEHLEAGYAPSFDRLKVREEELRRLLEIDNRMIGFAHNILETARIILGQVRTYRSFDPRYLQTLLESLDAIEATVEERRRFLHGGEAVGGQRRG